MCVRDHCRACCVIRAAYVANLLVSTRVRDACLDVVLRDGLVLRAQGKLVAFPPSFFGPNSVFLAIQRPGFTDEAHCCPRLGYVIPLPPLITTRKKDLSSRTTSLRSSFVAKPIFNACHKPTSSFPPSPSGHQSPDRLASIAAAEELKRLFPWHEWRLICVDASYEDVLSHAGEVWRVMQASAAHKLFVFASLTRLWSWIIVQ